MNEVANPVAAGNDTAINEAGVKAPMSVNSVEDVAAGLLSAVTVPEEKQDPVAAEVPADDEELAPSEESDEANEESLPVEAEDADAKSIKDLPEDVREQVQGIIERRIGQVVKQRKVLEQELELAESRARRADEQRAELESKLAEADQASVSTVVDPLLLADEAKVDAYDQHLAELEKLAIKNWDGMEDKDGREWSAQDVRAQYQAIREQRERLVPKAREVARQRTQFEQVARQLHPELFDRKTQEYSAINAYMRSYPQLRAIPNIHIILGDAIKFERLRAEQQKAKGEPKKAEAKKPPAAPVATSIPPPPRPSGPAPSLADFSRVVATGGNDPEAIAMAVASLS